MIKLDEKIHSIIIAAKLIDNDINISEYKKIIIINKYNAYKIATISSNKKLIVNLLYHRNGKCKQVIAEDNDEKNIQLALNLLQKTLIGEV